MKGDDKPVIGITVDCEFDPENERTKGSLSLNWNYAQAVADAGGVPLIVPPMADMAIVSGLIDGWLIPGGNDIDAVHFGEENHPEAVLQDPARFSGESALFEKIPPEMPVFGICYGCQFLNVVQGGALIQHLPDLESAEIHTGGLLQAYKITKNSRLSEVVGTAASGKSYHHQAIKTVGQGLEVTATSEDGVVEAIESCVRPWMIGVQWHPERTLENGDSQALFTKFVQAAKQFKTSRKAAQCDG